MKTFNYILLFFFLLILACVVLAADNSITVDQVGSGNSVTINQSGTGRHTATINMGSISDVDYTILQINQEGAGNKISDIRINSGINNTVNVIQQGEGNHTNSIQNLTGGGNNITITQRGDGKHEFNIVNGAGTTNSGNTITGHQNGGVGSDKWFNVWLNGSVGATVNVIQDNATTADQASMNIQCLSGTCGTFSYIKH